MGDVIYADKLPTPQLGNLLYEMKEAEMKDKKHDWKQEWTSEASDSS